MDHLIGVGVHLTLTYLSFIGRRKFYYPRVGLGLAGLVLREGIPLVIEDANKVANIIVFPRSI